MSEDELVVRADYERQFNERNRRNELKKKTVQKALKEMEQSRSDESSESEDEDAELLTAEMDKEIFDTLLKIRNKDPSIYSREQVFRTPDNIAIREKKEKQKHLSVKEAMIDEMTSKDDSNHVRDMSHVEEQKYIKTKFVEAADISESEEELFFSKKNGIDVVPDEENVDAGVSEYFSSEFGDKKDSEFLKNYLFQEWWKKDPSQVPQTSKATELYVMEDDEEELQKQDEFEQKHNFRFEESGSTKVQTFPREIDDSLRRKKSKRAEQRKRKADRLQIEKQKRLEELQKLQNLKQRQINEKIAIIQKVAGCDASEISKFIDLDADFDDEKFDEQMQSLFNSKFYENDEGDEYPDIEFVEDYEIEEPFENKDIEEEAKTVVSDIISAKKELEGLYEQNFEDLLGDSSGTRFKYISVPKHDFGLSTKKVLELDEQTLNQMISLKKLAPYREDADEMRTWKELRREQKRKYKEYMAANGGKKPKSENM